MLKDNKIGKIIGRRAAKELRVDDIVNIGIGIPEMVSRYARKSGMLDMVTLTVESGGIGGFPVSGEAFGAMIGAASVYDMANQFDLYDNGGLDICFMGALEVDQSSHSMYAIPHMEFQNFQSALYTLHFALVALQLQSHLPGSPE